MVDAQKFYAKAKGNSFPFCLEKVDVSTFDYWSTTGGYNKDAVDPVTPEQLSLSLQNVWRLYWPLYSVTAKLDVNEVISTQTANSVDDLISGSDTPILRLCPDPEYGVEFGGFDESIGILQSNFYGDSGGLVRMYNGVTTDESNFVGYGVKSDITSWFDYVTTGARGIGIQWAGADMVVALLSYVESESVSPPSDIGYGYTEINGVHFVCLLHALVSGTGTVTRNFPERSITVDEPSLGDIYTLSIETLEFYNPV